MPIHFASLSFKIIAIKAKMISQAAQVFLLAV